VNRQSLAKLAFAAAILLIASQALADIPSDGLLNDVTDRFLVQSATWAATITRYATRLFWVLATISMVWTFGFMALRKADIGEFFAEFIKFTVTTGFFWWLLVNGPTMAMSIVNSLREIGATASGLPKTLEPSTPISIGFDIVRKAFAGLSWVHPIDNLAVVLISAAVVLCMAVVAANVLIALVTAWTMAYAGTFILGFGGARWTSDMAISYFKAMLGIGLELMTMTLLLGIAISVTDSLQQQLRGTSVYELLLVLCVCAVLALLINKIPARLAALVGGGSGAGVGVGSVMGGAAMVAASVATAGAALAASAVGIGGGAQALMAAYSKASAAESASGGGGSVLSGAGGGESKQGGGGSSPLAAAMGGGAEQMAGGAPSVGAMSEDAAGESTSAARDTSGEPQLASSNTGKGGPEAGGTSDTKDGSSSHTASKGAFASSLATAGKAGRIVSGTVANLAKGSWDVAQDRGIRAIGSTTGGKIAAALRQDEGGSGKSPFDGNSFFPGSGEEVDAESEIAAFRDGPSKVA
jgi:type IV secretion system protein TrbL